MTPPDANRDKDPSVFWLIILALLLVGLEIVAAYVLLSRPGWTRDQAFAAIAAGFSGLAFGGVIYAIFLQRAELRAQRQELRDTREVVKQQREEMTLQNETLRQQTFENSFFQLLRFHRETVRYLQASPGQSGAVFNGVSALQAAAAEIAGQVSTLQPIDPKNERVVEKIGAIHGRTCLAPHSDFGHYFRTLYHLLTFVHESDAEDKQHYANLVRAQLSQHEQTLLFSHGIHQRGRNKWPVFIRDYALLFEVQLPPQLAPFGPVYVPRAYGFPDNVQWTDGVGWTTPLSTA